MSRVFGHALDIVSGAMSNPRATGSVKLSMKRFFSALAGLLALGWSGMALAQAATSINTNCLSSFTCAFSAAETYATGTPKNQGTPGQPDVFVGYIGFDATGIVTMTGMQNINGAPGTLPTKTSSGCVAGTGGATSMGGVPAVITFTDGTKLAYVLDSNNTPTLLQFILTNDATNANPTTANSIRVGTCHKLI